MITTNGKNIIAKYLLNQAPEFASHIAVGVGGDPFTTSSSATFTSDAKSLEFEAYRVPILSKGLVKDFDNEGNPVEKIIFKAELPSDQRFQINEIGIYPAESNRLAESYGSKVISSFGNSEPWVYSRLGSASVVVYDGPIFIDPNSAGDVSDYLNDGTTLRPNFIFIDSNSPIFEFTERRSRSESPRYLGKSLLTSGDFSVLDETFNIEAPSASASYFIENNSINLNLGKNLPTDQVKFALSVISKNLEEASAPTEGVRIRLEFINAGSTSSKAYVNMSLSSADFDGGRYQVITKSLSDFVVSDPSFSWSNIGSIRIYGCVLDDNPEDYLMIFDGIRFENISTYNPLYSLIAAEYLKTIDGVPVLKKENSTSYIEYRFGLGVL